MVLPGIQALFGFQLIAVFNRPFFDLGAADRAVHLAALVLVGVAIAFIMAPAAYHRLARPGHVSDEWLGLASRHIARAMAVLMVAMSLEVYVVAVMAFASHLLGAVLGTLVGGLLAWLWFAVPLLSRLNRGSGIPPAA